MSGKIKAVLTTNLKCVKGMIAQGTEFIGTLGDFPEEVRVAIEKQKSYVTVTEVFDDSIPEVEEKGSPADTATPTAQISTEKADEGETTSSDEKAQESGSKASPRKRTAGRKRKTPAGKGKLAPKE